MSNELTFADRFKTWRRDMGITREVLAAKLGVSISTIDRWERGDRISGGIAATPRLAEVWELELNFPGFFDRCARP